MAVKFARVLSFLSSYSKRLAFFVFREDNLPQSTAKLVAN